MQFFFRTLRNHHVKHEMMSSTENSNNKHKQFSHMKAVTTTETHQTTMKSSVTSKTKSDVDVDVQQQNDCGRKQQMTDKDLLWLLEYIHIIKILEEEESYRREQSAGGFYGLSREVFVESMAAILPLMYTDAEEQQQQKAKCKFSNRNNDIPSVSLHDYLDRFSRFTYCSAECYILSLIYLERIVMDHPNFVISSQNIHRLVITSLIVAIKFFDDKTFPNAFYARVAGITPNEVNLMERAFLNMISYKLHVTPELFEQYKNEVVTLGETVQKESLARQQQQLQDVYSEEQTDEVTGTESSEEDEHYYTNEISDEETEEEDDYEVGENYSVYSVSCR